MSNQSIPLIQSIPPIPPIPPIPSTLPNHFWCVQCSKQYEQHQRTNCLSPRCNASYCQNCVSDFHATYYQIPTQTGSLPQQIRSRCRYCSSIFHLEFFKAAKCLPTNFTNIGDLHIERQSIRRNYLLDQLTV